MAARPPHDRPDVFEVTVPVSTVWTRPNAPRDVDRDAVAADPDVARWTASMDAGVRKGLDGRTLTQVLMGERVQVVDADGEWVRVRALLQSSSKDETGYPGWMPRAHLAAPVPRTDGATAVVLARSTVASIEGGTKVELSFGTALWADGRTGDEAADETVGVELPGDRRATVPRADVRLSDEAARPSYTVDGILGSARQFLGMRYLWGGTSAWGLDCSGLVHLTYRAYGVAVPRDAFDQAEHVTPVALEDVEPGDLYFFARPNERIYHVGFVTRRVSPDGTRWMLHAPESGEFIEDAPMAPHRVETLVSAGRVRLG